jgi:hypothetical protein
MLNPPHRRETRFLPERDGPERGHRRLFQGLPAPKVSSTEQTAMLAHRRRNPPHGDEARSTDQAGGGVSARTRVATKTSC